MPVNGRTSTLPGWFDLGTPGGIAATAGTIAAVAAGAALLEAALLPSLAIGAAAVIAPRFLMGGAKAKPSAKPAADRYSKPEPKAEEVFDDIPEEPVRQTVDAKLGDAFERMKPGRALAKTITFRVVVTTLDFSTNFIILGSLTTAAGLSGFSLVAGPVFYFIHESAWNYFGGKAAIAAATKEDKGVRVVVLGYKLTPALAKTITYRVMATVAEFTTSYIVVQDVATAVLLSSTGFVLGPFVYYGHERAWEYFGGPDIVVEPEPASSVARLESPILIQP